MKGINHFLVEHWMGDVVYKETSFLGNLRIRGGQKLSGDILFYNIEKRSTNKYYISLCCKNIECKEFQKTNKAIGLDIGVHDFLTMSNRVKIDNPKFLE